MACYDDVQGVWPTVMSLVHHHRKQLGRFEIIVVDNNPTTRDGKQTKSFAEHSMPSCVRYIPFDEQHGTAQPRNEVFRQARGEYTICLDSHVILTEECLPSILDYYAENPDTRDLIVGPYMYDSG